MARLRTPACELFGIEAPIFAAGMADVTLAPLAGAVSAAGGLGVMGLTYFTPERIGEEIRALRRITDRPFGVGLLFPGDMPDDLAARAPLPFPAFLADLLPAVEGLVGASPPPLTLELARAQAEAALEARAPVIAAGLGAPDWLIAQAHRVGTKVIALVGSTEQALRAEAAGADCIVAQGLEAGGHTGAISTLVLATQAARVVKIPLLAAGGLVNGEGVAAALACGAQGAWIGTRFLVTRESAAHQNHKRAVLSAGEYGTAISRCYTGKPSRIPRNAVQERWKGREAEILPMPWQAMRLEALVEPARAAGRMDLANFPTGQGAAMINDIPNAGELVERLVGETIAALERCARYIER